MNFHAYKLLCDIYPRFATECANVIKEDVREGDIEDECDE